MRHVLKKLLVVSKKTCKTSTLSFTHSGHAEQLLFSCLCSKVTLTFSHCHSHSLTLSHSHTLSISHSLTLDMLNNFCFHVYAQKSLSHFHTLSLSHSHTLALSHSFNLSFNHSRHAEQVLFSSLCSKVAVYSRKMQ